MKQLWHNSQAETKIMKALMIGLTLAFGIVIGACTVQSHADTSKGTFNGSHLKSPFTGTTLDRVDDRYNQCYFLNVSGEPIQMSCVHTDIYRGSDDKEEQ